MTSFLDNISHGFFARLTQPKSSLLRDTDRNAVKSELTIGNTRINSENSQHRQIVPISFGRDNQSSSG